ncbi:MAG TPA: hypothetical protein VF510_23975, partial [Ktedonobacterales bacterium]
MEYPSVQELLFAALCLVIPIAIVLGHRRPNGPIVACGGAALTAFAAFWLLLGGINAVYYDNRLASYLTFFGGALLLLAGWALALSSAAQARRWEWVALLTTAGYLSVVAIIFSITQPNRCIFGPPPGAGQFYPICTATYPFAYMLVVAGYLAGPAATLAYGLRSNGLRRGSHELPEGLSVSSLRVSSAPY